MGCDEKFTGLICQPANDFAHYYQPIALEHGVYIWFLPGEKKGDRVAVSCSPGSFNNALLSVNGILRYTEQSCTDLVPRNQDHYLDEVRTSRSRSRNFKKKRHDFESDIPYKVIVTGERYRRNTDLVVQIDGGSFEGLMLQSRVVSGGELLRGGVGLVGQFRYLPKTFVHLVCFDIPFATVVDRGQPIQLGNISFIWTAPDTEAGDIRFIASVNRGIHYWVIVSKTLEFNPFPISAYGCGTTLACFRVCPSDQNPCIPRDAMYVLSYNTDSRDRGEIQFTMGGRITNNNTYVAVAFGEDFPNLIQADMVVCYLERGRVRIEHLLVDSIQTTAYGHTDPIELEDSDFADNMLWCRFNRRAIYDRKQSFYHFYFFGTIDYYYPQRELTQSANSDSNDT
ncbi:unnamed protein product [Allacma fusca]|uniref:DOMON domain-containing protein n=1 Tax=Allacma fusca TaxID=39272 RepID=A0A8J2PS21_9HEXA|nr:unnamed protein product [Allacma fusca]